ncbi:MAG: helix-turn-helix transcriptional regulator [Planctomycetes bacterium]|nr:helix-turn-helix transcriptional regulator [Planctomycetota bacterium]
MKKDRLPKSLYSPTYARFLVELRNTRLDAGLTQIDAAERLGRPQSFVSKCESGERRVDVAEFLAFCQAFEVDPCEVIRKLLKPKAEEKRKSRKPLDSN